MNKINYTLPFWNQVKYTNLVSGSKTDGQFRNTIWDPILIISQITALQCLYYLALGCWLIIICFLIGTSRSLDHIFKYEELHIRDNIGKLVVVSFLLNALCGSFFLSRIVQRTKLCLDFSCTIHLFHLLSCWYYNGYFPSAFSWWSLNIVCLSVMCICGEFLCMRIELKSIPLAGTPRVDL